MFKKIFIHKGNGCSSQRRSSIKPLSVIILENERNHRDHHSSTYLQSVLHRQIRIVATEINFDLIFCGLKMHNVYTNILKKVRLRGFSWPFTARSNIQKKINYEQHRASYGMRQKPSNPS